MVGRGVGLTDVAAFYGVSKQYVHAEAKRSGAGAARSCGILPETLTPKERAQLLVTRAIGRGVLKPRPCAACAAAGVPAPAARHPGTRAWHDDYDKPLAVRWLCHAHYDEREREPREPPPTSAVTA